MTKTTTTGAVSAKAPRKPTGKLAFAYDTIKRLDAQVAEMKTALAAPAQAISAEPAGAAPDEQMIADYGIKASRMMARDQTRFDAACEVMQYLKDQHAPYYYMHRMSTVLHGNTEGTKASRAPDNAAPSALDDARAARGAAQAAPVDAAALTQAARDVLAERQRQISAEGWTPEHDDMHSEGELSCAAAGYAVAASDQIQCVDKQMDDSTIDDDICAPTMHGPWPAGWVFKRCSPRRALAKAGALILAEMERLDRDAARAAQGGA